MAAGERRRDAVVGALTTTGAAILTSASALAAGFLALTWSSVEPNRHLGLLISVSVFSCALMTLVAAPTAMLAGSAASRRARPSTAARGRPSRHRMTAPGPPLRSPAHGIAARPRGGAQRILVTGAAGYAGSALVRQLLAAGHDVRGVDLLLFGDHSVRPLFGTPGFEFARADVCDGGAMAAAAAGIDTIVHLAAIVGDPACASDPGLAARVNLDAAQALYELAASAGVRRFVFASTCSNYGRGRVAESYVDETSVLAPLSVYAETKVAVERHLLAQPRARACVPVCLRFATAYGLSPRPRFDLTVNEFTRELTLGRELVVYGAHTWRPYCHVRDLMRAVTTVIAAPDSLVAFEVFNVGATEENYTKAAIVERVRRAQPEGRVRFVADSRPDPRDYRVRFDKIRDRLGYSIRWRVPDGIAEIQEALHGRLLGDPDDPRYCNTAPAAPPARG
jgi:nucleoside-diphosphate-sugar epimerase